MNRKYDLDYLQWLQKNARLYWCSLGVVVVLMVLSIWMDYHPWQLKGDEVPWQVHDSEQAVVDPENKKPESQKNELQKSEISPTNEIHAINEKERNQKEINQAEINQTEQRETASGEKNHTTETTSKNPEQGEQERREENQTMTEQQEITKQKTEQEKITQKETAQKQVEQKESERNETESNKIEENRTEENKIEQNQIKQNKTEQNKIAKSQIGQNEMEQLRIEQTLDLLQLQSKLSRFTVPCKGMLVYGYGFGYDPIYEDYRFHTATCYQTDGTEVVAVGDGIVEQVDLSALGQITLRCGVYRLQYRGIQASSLAVGTSVSAGQSLGKADSYLYVWVTEVAG